MNSAVFSHLPRFHPLTDRQPADWLRALTGAAEVPRAAGAAEAVAEDLPVAAPAVVAAAVPAVTDGAALEAAVKSLAGLVTRLETEAREHAAETLRAMAAELLPELSRAFLAEEIMRHLPALVPASAARFEIRAAPDIAARLADLAAQHAALAGRFDVVPSEGQGGASISWRTGGVTFDFDSLMRACLARLEVPKK